MNISAWLFFLRGFIFTKCARFKRYTELSKEKKKQKRKEEKSNDNDKNYMNVYISLE